MAHLNSRLNKIEISNLSNCILHIRQGLLLLVAYSLNDHYPIPPPDVATQALELKWRT
jgi:hypothetical protein